MPFKSPVVALALATLTAFLAPAPVLAISYPECWIKAGECLDHNQGPLLIGVKPANNSNVIDEAIPFIDTFDECIKRCMADEECQYATFYSDIITLDERNDEKDPKMCYLVGQNLKHACFNLEKTCVLLRECQRFNASCTTCQVLHFYITKRTPLIVAISQGHH